MTHALKSTRQSTDGKLVYQIEYIPRSHKSEYRMRRGGYGTWTRWFQNDNLQEVLESCGFNVSTTLTLLHDFYVEAHFGRGTIRLTQPMVKRITEDALLNAEGRHVYSRLKQTGVDSWVIPSSAIDTERIFWYLHTIIKNNLL